MEEKIRHIFKTVLKEEIVAVKEIIGLGQVNRVYEIIGNQNEYIVRANNELTKKMEYQKEKWCLQEMRKIGVKVPRVIKVGKRVGINYMILENIKGINGTFSTRAQKLEIWYRLGIYAKKYQSIKRIKVVGYEKNEFHKNWNARLDYNIKELHPEDSLLKNKILTKKAQIRAIEKLKELKGKSLQVGLVHGDLSTRNVMVSAKGVYLIDWGTAEINVAPHNEIGLILMSNEANKQEFSFFLKGLGLSKLDYKNIENEILKLNLLHTLDKYRWAESHDLENLKEYGKSISKSFHKINEYQ